MRTTLDITDQFCGAGGSSLGAHQAIKEAGGEIKLALNHWKLAIETHNTNFQDTLHDCTDVSACDPRRYPSTTILITSPECTNHSLSKGQKQVRAQMDLFKKGKLDPAAERSRATMWDVPRFAEHHKYKAIVVENVVDARKWIMYPAWLKAMELLGYDYKEVYINSMHCWPTPQSRDRMYVVFWKKGIKTPDLEFKPLAYCPECGTNINAVQRWKKKRWGKYRTQYLYACEEHNIQVDPYYYASFNCIDWSNPGTRIGDRKKPLSDNTLRRIKYGLEKYKDMAFQVINYSPGTAKPLSDPFQTITATDHHGLASPHMKFIQPFIIKSEHSRANNVSLAINPLPTQTARQSMAMVLPFIVKMNRTGGAQPADWTPMATVTAGGINHSLVNLPFQVINKGKSLARGSNEPLPTQTAISNTGIVTTEAFQAFLSQYYNGSDCTRHVTDPAGTFTTMDRTYMIQYQDPVIEDCYYRMLVPHEVQAGMAFPEDYIVLGNSKQQVRQLGNAVTPPAMKWLIQQLAKVL